MNTGDWFTTWEIQGKIPMNLQSVVNRCNKDDCGRPHGSAGVEVGGGVHLPIDSDLSLSFVCF